MDLKKCTSRYLLLLSVPAFVACGNMGKQSQVHQRISHGCPIGGKQQSCAGLSGDRSCQRRYGARKGKPQHQRRIKSDSQFLFHTFHHGDIHLPVSFAFHRPLAPQAVSSQVLCHDMDGLST